MVASVSTIYETNYRHIPDMVRDFAKTVEEDTENPTEVVAAVRLQEDGTLLVYGWGHYNDHTIIALLEQAKYHILKG